MQPRINDLQTIVRKIMRDVLEWGELRLKKITMSHDASNNPACLYGEDGKIYYCTGGSCAELGSGTGGLWEVTAIGSTDCIAPISNRPVILDYVWLKDGGVNEDSSITFWVEHGGGGGGHPNEQVE